MEHVQKKAAPIPVVEENQPLKKSVVADQEQENVRSKSFMETSESVLGASNKQNAVEPPLNFEVWFPADGTVNLDAFQLNLLSQIATNNAITSGAATFARIKGGSLTMGFSTDDWSGALEVANARANAVDAALGGPGIYIPADLTVANYKNGSLENSDVEFLFNRNSFVEVHILFNTNARQRDISRIKDLALQIDGHTR